MRSLAFNSSRFTVAIVIQRTTALELIVYFALEFRQRIISSHPETYIRRCGRDSCLFICTSLHKMNF